jgi:hypothetical protein
MTTEEKAIVRENIAVEMLELRHAREIEAIKEEHNLAFKKLADFTKEQKKEYQTRIEDLETDLSLSKKRELKWKGAYSDIEDKYIKYQKERHQLVKKSLEDTISIKTLEDMFDQLLEENKLILIKLRGY